MGEVRVQEPGPQSLSDVLAKLIAMRGYARKQGDAQLQAAWSDVAGPDWSGKTRATAIRRGVLHVAVCQAALLSELVAFHRRSLLSALREKHPHLRVRDLKFQLEGGMRPPGSAGS